MAAPASPFARLREQASGRQSRPGSRGSAAASRVGTPGASGLRPSAAPAPVRLRPAPAAAAAAAPRRAGAPTSSRVATSRCRPRRPAKAAARSAASAGSSPAGSTSSTRRPGRGGQRRSSSALGGVERVAARRCRSARARRPPGAPWPASVAGGGWRPSRLRRSSRVKAASCSVAPARPPSAVTTMRRDRRRSPAAPRAGATVSVLPAPGGPASSSGARRGISGSGANRSARAERPASGPCRELAGERRPARCGTRQRPPPGGGRAAGGAGAAGLGAGSSAAVTSTPCRPGGSPGSPPRRPGRRGCAMASAMPVAR